MTIQVTIKHDNVGYPKNVEVKRYIEKNNNTVWDESFPAKVIKGGESIQVAVWSGVSFAFYETEEPADSDKNGG